MRDEEQVEGVGEEDLVDSEKPHQPTLVLGVYWMATSATNRLCKLYSFEYPASFDRVPRSNPNFVLRAQ